MAKFTVKSMNLLKTEQVRRQIYPPIVGGIATIWIRQYAPPKIGPGQRPSAPKIFMGSELLLRYFERLDLDLI